MIALTDFRVKALTLWKSSQSSSLLLGLETSSRSYSLNSLKELVKT